MKWILSLFLFVLKTVVSELLTRTNSSNLCYRIPSQSCLHQLEPAQEDFEKHSQVCTVETFKKTQHPHICDDQKWIHEEICMDDGCGVHLEIYRHIPHPSLFNLKPPPSNTSRTALNLTLSNILFDKVKIRFHEFIYNFTFCINFTTSSNAAQPFDSLWYDCIFHESELTEGKPFQLEFLNGPKYGVYYFKLPNVQNISKGFLYVHSHLSPNIVITFQEMPGLNNSNMYSIILCKWLQNSCHTALQHMVDLRNSLTFTSRYKDLITVSMGKLSFSGNFSIQVSDPNCDIQTDACYQATSPIFSIKDSHFDYIVFLLILGIFVIAVLCLGVVYRKKIKLYMSGIRKGVIQNKTILLIHDSTTSDYCWIEAVKMMLETWDGFHILVDFIEIPRSRHKDPLLWYTESMNTADIVAVVAPSLTGASIPTDQRSAIYHHTFDLALELLAMRISRRLKLKERDVLQQFVVLQTRSSTIPDVCSSFSRFVVPEEFPNLITYMGEDVRGVANNRSFAFADSLVQRWTHRDRESTLMDTFRLIHEHLLQRNKSLADAEHAVHALVDDAQCVAERSSLLNAQNEEDGEIRSQQLNREFGPAVVGLANLQTLG